MAGKGCYWHFVVEARGALPKILECPGKPTHRHIQSKMALVPRLRNPAIKLLVGVWVCHEYGCSEY